MHGLIDMMIELHLDCHFCKRRALQVRSLFGYGRELKMECIQSWNERLLCLIDALRGFRF